MIGDLGHADGLKALGAVRLSWAATPDDVWDLSATHVEGLQDAAETALKRGLDDAWQSPGPSPVGLVLEGSKGVGKTHLLGWMRRQVQSGDGYFFLVQYLAGTDFWRSVVQGYLEGLLRPVGPQGDQLTRLLTTLGDRFGADRRLADVLAGDRAPRREHLDAFVEGLRSLDRQLGIEAADTARALVLYTSPQWQQTEVGRAFLSLGTEVDEHDRAEWGLQRGERPAQLVVRDLSRLVAATNEPAIVAIDQMDVLIAQATRDGLDTAAESLLDTIADGLMSLRDETRKTLVVLSLLPTSWRLVQEHAVATAADRFRTVRLREGLPDVDTARDLVAAYLGSRYSRAGFTPPHPTWPLSPESFGGAGLLTARELLQAVDAHVRRCLDDGAVTELADIATGAVTGAGTGAPGGAPAAGTTGDEIMGDEVDLAGLDAEFARLRARAHVGPLLDPANEDDTVPALLRAALTALVEEERERALVLDPPPPRKRPALHARLREVVDAATEDERHWAFRAVGATHHTAVRTRLQEARVAAGLGPGLGGRTLVLLRSTPWPGGAMTARTVAEVAAAGGRTVALGEEDVRTFDALRVLLAADPPGLRAWLADRRPAGRSDLLGGLLSDAAPRQAADAPGSSPADPGGSHARRVPQAAGPAVVIGRDADGRPFEVPLDALREHSIVLAGSGSGKTVLLRRLVEEVALAGVSSIVLDVNDDFAGLGEVWDAPPPGWWAGDQARSRELVAATDVVVWTPGRAGGRPLPIDPLPDLTPLAADSEEFSAAVASAVASLVRRAGVTGTRKQADESRTVLREAVAAFVRGGGTGIADFVTFLAGLPEDAGSNRRASLIAGEMARSLATASPGPVDPGLLLTPAPGSRARVSVVSLGGLVPDEREVVVGELLLALTSWVEQHPAHDDRLSGLVVMDEAESFASSRRPTSCTETTVRLASRAGEHGIGFVFATRSPRHLDGRLTGTATTQLIGMLNAPVHIEAARELAAARGGELADVSRLPAGTFHAATRGTAFRRIRVPMSLSRHTGPLTPDEVLERAATGPGAPR